MKAEASVTVRVNFIRRVVPSGVRDVLLWLVPLLRLLPFRRRTIMREGAPYLTRIYLTPSTGRLGKWWRSRFRGRFLHCFHMSDPDGLHNHPWRDARSLILRGAYYEERVLAKTSKGERIAPEDVAKCYATTRIYWPGDSNMLTEFDWHHVELMSDEVWTLFSVGAKHGKGWGFSTGRRGTSDES
jgi:hypothetical protein